MFQTNGLIIIGSISLLTCIISLVRLHLLPTGYQPFRDPVSNYAVGKYGQLYSVQTIASGIAAVSLLIVLKSMSVALPQKGETALKLFALTRLVIFLFPTDVKPPVTLKGFIHIILAAITFTCIALATGDIAPVLSGHAIWSPVSFLLTLTAKIIFFSAIAFLVTWGIRPLRRVAGLMERFIYLGFLFWFATAFFSLMVHMHI
jgi:hypothetical protein